STSDDSTGKRRGELFRTHQVMLEFENYKTKDRSTLYLGYHDKADEGLDKYDQYFPPGKFRDVDIVLMNGKPDSRNGRLLADVRPSIAQGQRYNVNVNARSATTLAVKSFLDNELSAHELYLVNRRIGKFYNLRDNQTAYVDVVAGKNEFELLVGALHFIEDIKSTTLPQQAALLGGYPNPFNQRVALEIAIPGDKEELQHALIEVYNVAGQYVDTVLERELSPGLHKVVWDLEQQQANMPSGVYFMRMVLESGFSETTGVVHIK
ncbi:MAG: T9SS type A sorting domain-containing protein, partial [Bacteroidota bacterium]